MAVIQSADNHPHGYLKQNLESLLSLAKEPNVHLCRFENLVGPAGGGTLEKQKEEVLRLAEFINIQLSEEQLNFICQNLYGRYTHVSGRKDRFMENKI